MAEIVNSMPYRSGSSQQTYETDTIMYTLTVRPDYDGRKRYCMSPSFDLKDSTGRHGSHRVFSYAQGPPGRVDEHQVSIPSVRPAQRYRVQDALQLCASGGYRRQCTKARFVVFDNFRVPTYSPCYLSLFSIELFSINVSMENVTLSQRSGK